MPTKRQRDSDEEIVITLFNTLPIAYPNQTSVSIK